MAFGIDNTKRVRQCIVISPLYLVMKIIYTSYKLSFILETDQLTELNVERHADGNLVVLHRRIPMTCQRTLKLASAI